GRGGGRWTPGRLPVSAMSEGPAEGRQEVPAGWTRSVGQAALAPVHSSGRSQTSAAGWQTKPAGLRASVGQLLLAPLQDSSRSQGPTAGRQTPVLFTSGGQAPLEPF